MGLLKGGEMRAPKSWGNGYLRFSVMDLAKLAVFIAGVVGIYYGIQRRTDRVEYAVRVSARELRAEIRETARGDSLRSARHMEQERDMWDEEEKEHLVMWKAIGKPPPPRKRFLERWKLTGSGWERDLQGP